MTRHVTREMLHAYLDGDLSWDERRKVREHIAGCPACKAELEQLRWAERALQHMAALSVPDTFVQTVLQRARTQGMRPTSGPAAWLWAAHALVAISLGLLFLVAWEVLTAGADVATVGLTVNPSDPTQVYELLTTAALQVGETALPLALGLLALGLFLEVSRWLPWLASMEGQEGTWKHIQSA